MKILAHNIYVSTIVLILTVKCFILENSRIKNNFLKDILDKNRNMKKNWKYTTFWKKDGT